MTPAGAQDDDAPPGREVPEESAFFLDGTMFDGSSRPDSVADLPPSTEDLRFVRELGRGGMGVVYEAEERASGRSVAVKVLLPTLHISSEALERFARESRTAASISHPNCVYVYGSYPVDGRPALAMELMRGDTFEDRIKAEGPIAVEVAVRWTLDVLRGLAAIHEAGLIHRDLKPSNVFLDETGVAKIGDFGLSRSGEANLDLTRSGVFVGSPRYASPEQVRGRSIDQRTDLYSVGATLYALLTGRAPHQSTHIGDLFAQITTEAPPPPRKLRPDLPRALEGVVLRALAKDPERRFASCAEFRRALRPLLPGTLSPASVPLRVIAYAIDLSLVALAVGTFAVLFVILVDRSPVWTFATTYRDLAITTIGILYFAITEARWSTSFGKRLLGLRVVDLAGDRPSMVRALARAALIHGSQAIPTSSWPTTAALVIGFLVPFVTMRRQSGFRGLHEYASGTRTIQARPVFRRLLTRLEGGFEPKRTPVADAPQVGGYTLHARVATTESGVLYRARDERLARAVWLHRVADAADAHPDHERSHGGPLRVIWLAGGEDGSGAFDVYEDIGGGTPDELAQVRRRIDWAMARAIFILLAEHLDEPVSSDRIWLDRHGRPRVLPFAIGAAPRAAESPLEVVGRLVRTFTSPRAHHAALLAPPLPDGAPEALRRLGGDAVPFPSLPALKQALEALGDAASPIDRATRIGQLALSAVAASLVGSLAAAIGAVVFEAELPQLPAWSAEIPTSIGIAFFLVVLGCLPAAALSWLMRGSVVFRILGIRVCDARGDRASRWRNAVRSLVTWLPFPIALALSTPAEAWGLGDATLVWAVQGLYLIGAIFAIIRPDAGLQDRLIRTRLVR